jgi:hypothetical protein
MLETGQTLAMGEGSYGNTLKPTTHDRRRETRRLQFSVRALSKTTNASRASCSAREGGKEERRTETGEGICEQSAI